MKTLLLSSLSLMCSAQSFAAVYDCTNTKSPYLYGGGPEIHVAYSNGFFPGEITDVRFGYQDANDANFEETTCERIPHGRNVAITCEPTTVDSPVASIIFHSPLGVMAQFKGEQALTFLDCKLRK